MGGEELPLGFGGVSWGVGVGAGDETKVVFCLKALGLILLL